MVGFQGMADGEVIAIAIILMVAVAIPNSKQG
jgi:hypothetical protein